MGRRHSDLLLVFRDLNIVGTVEKHCPIKEADSADLVTDAETLTQYEVFLTEEGIGRSASRRQLAGA